MILSDPCYGIKYTYRTLLTNTMNAFSSDRPSAARTEVARMLVREMNLHSPIDVCDWFSCLPAPQQHIMLTGFVSVLRLGATDVNGDDRPQTQTHMQTQSQTQSQSQSQSRSRRVLGDGYGAVPCVGPPKVSGSKPPCRFKTVHCIDITSPQHSVLCVGQSLLAVSLWPLARWHSWRSS